MRLLSAICGHWGIVKRMRWLRCRGSMDDKVIGLGHALARSCDIVGGRARVLWYVRCGAYAETTARKPANACKRTPSRAGKRNMDLRLKGWHPLALRKLRAPPCTRRSTKYWAWGGAGSWGRRGCGRGELVLEGHTW